jgi:hypothetical protein
VRLLTLTPLLLTPLLLTPLLPAKGVRENLIQLFATILSV